MTKNHKSSPRTLFRSFSAGNCLEYLMTYVGPVLDTGYVPIYDSREDAYSKDFVGIFMCLDENKLLVLDHRGDIYHLTLDISAALRLVRTIVNSRGANDEE